MGSLLKFERTKIRRKRKSQESTPPVRQRIVISLDWFENELGLELGNGDLELGIRRAIILASMRTDKKRENTV